ncbi:S41 family peptidase [Wenzhouxiangella sediminis]|uniref:S41 family peptidase n=1 Tax=Wenzhouxiangella sediminis TaxID=1792836 RepID=UPI0015F24885|nr:S41 family peptidase [Wenzhouxiangella sediminis]
MVGPRFILALVLLAAVAASHSIAAQQVDNGSFERSNAEGDPQSWLLQVRGLTVDLDDSASVGGSRALRISDSASGGSALVTQEIELGKSGFPGATLRGRIRTRDVSPSATLVAILEGPDGRIFMDDMRDRVVSGDSEWQEYRIHIPPSSEARKLTVGALVIGSGTAWFDDLALIDDAKQAADPDARAYLLEAISILRANYLHADDVDWEAVRQAGLAALPDGATREQARAAVSMMVQQLDDPHTMLAMPREAEPSNQQEAESAEPLSAEPLSAELIGGRIGLIRVPRVSGGTPEQAQVKFAENAHRTMKSIDSPDLCGWVVDLRDNTGGNMWPMLAAIGPIAGPGILGRFVGPEGGEVTDWGYREGAAWVSGDSDKSERIAVSVEPFRPTNPDLPVAVLISTNTSSSGEATAIAFIGRDNTRLFGSETGGLATANNGYALSDGTRIVLPIGYMADRHGQVHFPGVQPDEEVPADTALDAARTWLQAHESCAESS